MAAPSGPTAPTGEVADDQKTVRQAASESWMFATAIGVLSKGVSRLRTPPSVG